MEKLETEKGIWNQKWSARELKQNNENWNADGGLRDQLGFLENGDIVLEVSGDDSVELEVSEDGQNEVGGAVGDWSWIS